MECKKNVESNIILFSFLSFCIAFFLVEDIYAIENSPVQFNPVLRDHNVIVEEYVNGLRLPTTIAFIDNDLLVLEKNGNVRLIRDGVLQSSPVLTLEVGKTIEEGLIGILVKNNLVYLHYTTDDPTTKTTSNWIYKYQWDGNKLINPQLVKEIHGGNGIHNSGVMTMDADGTVFMVMGDLGNRKGLLQNNISGEPDDTSVIMPIDPPGAYYAIGIRNSYGLSFDPVTGFLWDTENGDIAFDEINLVRKNFNSGWDKLQGPSHDNQENVFPLEEFEYSDPEFSWEKPVGVTSIHFIQSPLFQEYHNSVFVGDFHNGILYKFILNENRDGFLFQDDMLNDLVFNVDDKLTETIFGTGFGGITDIKEGPDGLIYVVSIGYEKIYRIIPISKNTQLQIDCNYVISQSKNFSGCNFANLNLSNFNLSFSDLSYTNLENVDLTGASLVNATLVGSNLSNTRIINTDFSNANLDSALMAELTITDSKFVGASLKSTDFENSIFINTDFSNANLGQAIFSGSYFTNTNLQNAYLVGTDFSDTKMPLVNMENSILNKANFQNSNLESGNLKNTIIYKAVFHNANLKNVTMIGSDNYKTNFHNANLKNVDFGSSRLSSVNFNGADMSGVNLIDIYPIDSNFDNVSFSEKSNINTCLEHDYLSRLINKILRTFRQNDQILFEPLENLLLKICN